MTVQPTTVVSATLLFYDIFLTFDQEVSLPVVLPYRGN
jgi:hypothetical protein